MSDAGDYSVFADDEYSPIPFVYQYDNVVTFAGGGAYLGVVIGAPITSCDDALARLTEKLRFYLESFYSDYGQKTWQTPKQGKMRIFVKIHHDSSPDAFTIIQEFKARAETRGVAVIISISG